MQPYQLLLSILLLTPTSIVCDPIAEPDFNPHAQALDNGSLAIEHDLKARQIAAGGGVVATTIASQMAVTTTAGSLFTVGGTTSATWKLFTQTFAATALGSWDLGPTPGVGSIGLGNIQGTVGKVKTKRALETPVPVMKRSPEVVPGEMV